MFFVAASFFYKEFPFITSYHPKLTTYPKSIYTSFDIAYTYLSQKDKTKLWKWSCRISGKRENYLQQKRENVMKIKIEIDGELTEDEVIIRCRGLTEQISEVQKAVSEVVHSSQKFVFYKGNTEYYLTLDEILFFETDSDGINAHTKDNIYQTKYKLYELEELSS